MDLAPKRFADTVVLHPTGRINHVGSDGLKAALEPFLASCAGGQDQIVLDLSALEYISSAGLRVVLVVAKQVARSEGKFALAAMRPEVLELFKVSGLSSILEIFDTPEAATAALEAA